MKVLFNCHVPFMFWLLLMLISRYTFFRPFDRLSCATYTSPFCVVWPGHGAYLPAEKYPAGSDMKVLSKDGSAVGKLDKLRVPDKYTVFDVYAEWCGPCRFVDARLREVVATRKDVAVRKLNVVDFDTPLAKELGSRIEALPYVIVFDAAGKRTDIVGADFDKLDKALGVTR